MAPNTQFTYANRFYMLAQLVELRPLYLQVSQNLGRYKELKAMENDGRLFEDGRDAEVDELLNLNERFQKMDAEYAAWEKKTTNFLQMSLEEIKKAAGLTDKKKNKSGKEIDPQLPPLEKMKLLMDDVLGKDLWNGGNVKGSLAGMYIHSLCQYVCAPEAAKSADFDPYVVDKVEKINQILPRSVEYQSAQALLLEEIRSNSRDKDVLKQICSKYCRKALLQAATTKGPDNQFFRCMAVGRFYIKPGDEHYSEYFVTHYGKDFSLSPSAKGDRMPAGKYFNIDDMLKLTAETYDDKTADSLRWEIKAKGISEGDFPYLNAYDLCKIVQLGRAALNGTTQGRGLERIAENCPDTPYQRQARRLGMMLAIGGKYAAEEAKTGGDQQELKRRMGLFSLKAGYIMMAKTAYEENFKELYGSYDAFLQASAKAYRALERDFSKNGMREYFDKWIPQLCEGNNQVKDFDGKKPFEINIHHKIPVKMAKNLDNPAAINDVRNFCMFIEFSAPTGGKLTKHLQEHNKESAGMAVVEEKADMRFVVTSENTRLEHSSGKEPVCFSKLRQQIHGGGTVPGNSGRGGGEGR